MGLLFTETDPMQPGEHFGVMESVRIIQERSAKTKDYLVQNKGSMMQAVNWMDDASASFWFMPIVLFLVWPSGVPADFEAAELPVGIFIATLLLYCLAVMSRIVSYERDGFTWKTALWDAACSAVLFFPHVFLGFGLNQLEFVRNGVDRLFIMFTDIVGFVFTIAFVVQAFRKDKVPPKAKITKLEPKAPAPAA